MEPIEEIEQVKGRGGKRVGSGRPKSNNVRKNISIMLSQEAIDYLHSLDSIHNGEKGVRYSRYIEALIWADKKKKESVLDVNEIEEKPNLDL